jgi:hypothetical protein
MTVLWLFLGMLVALGIARYNESNKLFWILFISFIGCFAGAKAIHDSLSENERSEKSLNQAYPTQGLDLASDTCMCFLADEPMKTNVKVTSKPVGQANTPEYVERIYTSSNVQMATPGLYLHNLANPPNSVILYDTS